MYVLLFVQKNLGYIIHSAQIRANFAQNQPSKQLLRKKAEEKSSDDFEKEGAAHSQCPRPLRLLPLVASTSPKGRGFGSPRKVSGFAKGSPFGRAGA